MHTEAAPFATRPRALLGVFLPLFVLIVLALGVPVLSVGLEGIGQAWTAIYFDSGLSRTFCF